MKYNALGYRITCVEKQYDMLKTYAFSSAMGQAYFPPWISPNKTDAAHRVVISCGGQELKLKPWSGSNPARRNTQDGVVMNYPTRTSNTCCPPPNDKDESRANCYARGSMITDESQMAYDRFAAQGASKPSLEVKYTGGSTKEHKRNSAAAGCDEGSNKGPACRRILDKNKKPLGVRPWFACNAEQIACFRSLYGETKECKTGVLLC